MFKNLFKKKPEPVTNVVVCEDCYFPKLNQFVRAHAPELWDRWLQEGVKNFNAVGALDDVE